MDGGRLANKSFSGAGEDINRPMMTNGRGRPFSTDEKL
jgi:hypothetical protein